MLLMAAVVVVVLLMRRAWWQTSPSQRQGHFEGTRKQGLGGWLESLGKTHNGLSQKQVIYLSNQAYRCLIAVGDTPGQQVGSIVFGLPADPKTTADRERS
jgi:hypothetical protein